MKTITISKVFMVRYPHGWNMGGIWDNEYAPAITPSAWESNNFLVEVYADRESTEAEG